LHILVRFRQVAQRRSWNAALEQHGAKFLVGFKESNSRIAIQEAQAMEFVLALHVWHPEFQYRGGSVSTRRRRHPRATHFLAFKGHSEREGPADTDLDSKEPSTWGSRLSHAARSGVLRQLAANSAGIGNAIPPLSGRQCPRSPMLDARPRTSAISFFGALRMLP